MSNTDLAPREEPERTCDIGRVKRRRRATMGFVIPWTGPGNPGSINYSRLTRQRIGLEPATAPGGSGSRTPEIRPHPNVLRRKESRKPMKAPRFALPFTVVVGVTAAVALWPPLARLFAVSPAAAAEPKPRDAFQERVLPLLERYCSLCHMEGNAEAGIDLE